MGPCEIPTCEALEGDMQGTHSKFNINLIIVKLTAQAMAEMHFYYEKNNTDYYLIIKFNLYGMNDIRQHQLNTLCRLKKNYIFSTIATCSMAFNRNIISFRV